MLSALQGTVTECTDSATEILARAVVTAVRFSPPPPWTPGCFQEGCQTDCLEAMLCSGRRHSVVTAAAILSPLFASGITAGSRRQQLLHTLIEQSVQDGHQGRVAALALVTLTHRGGLGVRAELTSRGLAPLFAMLRAAEQDAMAGAEDVAFVLRLIVFSMRAAELAVSCGAVDSCVALLVHARHEGGGDAARGPGGARDRLWVGVAVLVGELAASGGEGAIKAILESGAVLGLAAVTLKFVDECFWEGVGAVACALRLMAHSKPAGDAMAAAGVARCLSRMLCEGGMPAGHPSRLAAIETLLLLASDTDLQPLLASECSEAAISVLRQRCCLLSGRGVVSEEEEDGSGRDSAAEGSGRRERHDEAGRGGTQCQLQEQDLNLASAEASAAARLLLHLTSHESAVRRLVVTNRAADALLALVDLETDSGLAATAALVLGCLALDDCELQQRLPPLPPSPPSSPVGFAPSGENMEGNSRSFRYEAPLHLLCALPMFSCAVCP